MRHIGLTVGDALQIPLLLLLLLKPLEQIQYDAGEACVSVTQPFQKQRASQSDRRTDLGRFIAGVVQ